MNLKSFKKYLHDELKDLYSIEELDSLFFIIINYYLEISKIAYIQNPQKLLNKSIIKKIFSKIKLLKENMPIQYVIGEVVHKKLKFYLNNNVLIPRPETMCCTLLKGFHCDETIEAVVEVIKALAIYDK